MRTTLRRRVTLLAPEREEADGGGAEESFAEAAKVWAETRARAGGEAVEPGRLHALTVHELTIRHREDVRPGWRAVWSGRQRRVTAAFDPDGLRRRLTLICEEEE